MTSICFYNQTLEMNKHWYESHKTLIMNLCIEFDALERLGELTDKYLGVPIKLKKVKDPKKPKRTRSAFFFFCEVERPKEMDKCRNENRKINVGTISKILGKKWKTLSEEQRAKYVEMNKDDKQRYQEEMDEWKN